MAWRPIITAPQDGRYVLVFGEANGGYVIRTARFAFEPDGHQWVVGACHGKCGLVHVICFERAIMWMPLPEAPAIAIEARSAETTGSARQGESAGRQASPGKGR